MSRGGEHKRVTLTSIFQGDVGFSRFGSNILEPDTPLSAGSTSSKPTNKTAKCIRIKLDLFETDSNKYPEFNYSRLLYLEKKKAKKLKQVTTCNGSTGTDPFADNDDDVARIAKELEAKYGNSYATGRGKSKKNDYRDIGMGYDESDSFIDNTEAYDEIIPEEAETLEGGFYINCGALEFKNLTKKSYTTRTDAIIKMPERSRKRMVSSSSESSSSSSDDDDENDDDNEGEEDSDSEDDEEEDESDSEDNSESESLDDEDSAATAKSSSKFKDNHLAKRPKVIVTSRTKQSSSSTTGSKKPPVKPITTSSSSSSPRPNIVEISDTEEQLGQVQSQIQSQTQFQALPQPQTEAQAQAQALKKVVKTTTVKDMLKAKRDNFLKSQSGTAAVKGIVNGELKCISSDMSSPDNSDMESGTDQGRAEKQAGQQGKEGQENLRTADTLLPTTLDSDIMAAVNNFKEDVRSRDMCGKKFNLDAKLTPLLLRVYEAVLCIDRNERNMVFSHIEYQLQLPKYYMLRKGKQVRAKEEKKKSTIVLEKLRRAVAVVMPKAIANYETELRTFAEQAAADVNSELPPKMPRKKFQWTSDLRQLLYDVYQARWPSFPFLAKRKDTMEEFINCYLKEKVVDLWPSGWMRLDELQREISRYKNARQKAKEKSKAPAVSASPKPVVAVPASEQIPQASSYLKTVEEPRSRGNSDTDSATSASSNSLKRKLMEMPKQSNKPPKKKVAKQLPQQPQLLPHPQFQLAPAATAAVSVPATSINNNHLPHLDTLLSMPSTSAQAAALNAAAVAAASTVLDLASPNRKMDLNSRSNFYNLITAATLAASGNPSPHPIDGQAKVIVGARPSPHVINLDDYQCPSEILQTSKQLAATTTVITSTSKAAQTTPVGRESSSESDGVEIVGVFPASKPQRKVQPKAKNKTQNKGRSSLGAVGQANGSLGFNANNMYIYNSSRSIAPVYDLTSKAHIMKNLKEFEKQMHSAFSPTSVKGSSGGMGSSAPNTPSRQ
ncbi:yemanuclein [Drosophila rhopaloa]|uniref:Yemanuclein-alpha n=1 Tax=Drosophila rhopaloa TaxID=1041015 RepID=A0A6P4EFX9_DRORH|nr:yemanuclein [Drosophila rhopaloa]